ncbi:MAG TPA: hypothetical protein VIY48_00250 [Candidatus Paceibacterota bacterium]
MATNLLNKISVATVYGRIKTIIKEVDGEPKKMLEAPVMVMRVIGHATGYEVKSSQYGDSLAFKGTFKATNLETGEISHSGQCFLPNVMADQLGSVLDQVDSGAEFAVDVAAVPANNVFGYEYRVKPLLEVKESPILAALEARIEAPALPAPKGDDNKKDEEEKNKGGKKK